MKKQVCANPACTKPVGPLKVHGRWEFDPFCSSVCCKAVFAVGDSTDKGVYDSTRADHCVCGSPLDEYDPSCTACSRRRRKHRSKAAA